MILDRTEPMRAISLPPSRVLGLAMFVGISGVVALLTAVVVLIWTVTGVPAPAAQPETIRADIASMPAVAAPAGALQPAPAPAAAPAPAPVPAPAPAAVPAANAAGSNPGILQNPTMAAIAPTAPSVSSVPVSSGTVPTVAWPNATVPNVNWNDVGSALGLQNLNWAGLLWSGSGADATTSAIIGAATSIGNNAFNFVGNNTFDLITTLILANSGFYGSNGSGVGVPGLDQVATALSVPAMPQLGLPKLPAPPEIGLPKLPPPPQIGMPKLPPPPKLPGVGFGIPGTPIGIGF
jgi:hypothetical protein